jgi:tRNA/tmRNA/rRNA uracil-C5-methylase (TrmA/RlmC/RlmD family)
LARRGRGGENPDRSEHFEVVIESLAAGGDGVGHGPDGRVVFVPFSAPGDRLQVRPVRSKARFVHAEAVELLAPGPGRTDPLCPVFGTCGGCRWQHLDQATQTEAKEQIIRDAFARIAKLEVPRFRLHPSPEAYGYRSRARVLVEKGRVGFRRLRSHALCVTERCPVLVPELDEALASLAERAGPQDGEWELAVGDSGSPISAPLPAAKEGQRVSLRAGLSELEVSAGVFFQAHRSLRNPLRDALGGLLGSGDRALELYAGAGFFTGELARRFARVLAVEVGARAVEDLRENHGQTHGVEILHDSCEGAISAEEVAAFAPEVVVVDPPREGLTAQVVDGLLDRAPQRIAYISCDPATLARDLGLLADHRYELRHLEAFDFFPQTPHVECLALVELPETS